MSRYHSPSASLRFVNLQVCRVSRVRRTPAGTKYAGCNDYAELLTAGCGQRATYIETLTVACGSERVK